MKKSLSRTENGYSPTRKNLSPAGSDFSVQKRDFLVSETNFPGRETIFFVQAPEFSSYGTGLFGPGSYSTMCEFEGRATQSI